MENRSFPSRRELSDAVLYVLTAANGVLTAIEINKRVAEHLKLTDEILQLEDPNGPGTEYDYRMRWVRTELKKHGFISNPNRGEWIAIKQN